MLFCRTMIPRAFIYGDLLFESILVENGLPLHFDLHMKRLKSCAKQLGFTHLPDDRVLYDNIMATLAGKQHARIRLTLYRNSEGFYLPNKNECLVDIEIVNLVAKPEIIKKVGIYLENHKPCNSLSNLKSGNALIYVLAAKYANDLGWDDALIVNEYGNICEATSSNVFILINGEYLTPPLSEGCVEGIMRKVFIQELKAAHKQVVEMPISKELLKSAECIWLTNAIYGIRKVEKLLLT
jgi:branched-chain amino acid aminotransferase